MKKKFKSRAKTITLTVLLVVSVALFFISAQIEKSPIRTILLGISIFIWIASLIYAIVIAVPDYDFSLELRGNHLHFSNSDGYGIVFLLNSLCVNRKNRRFIVLEDKFNKLSIPYSKELENFLKEITWSPVKAKAPDVLLHPGLLFHLFIL